MTRWTVAEFARLIFAVAGLLVPASGQAQELRAVVVHGSAIPEAYILHEPAELAGCIYGATYHLQGAGRVQPDTTGRPDVTFSFFRESSWEFFLTEAGGIPESLDPARAMIHTRVVLGDDDRPPYFASRKALGLGAFAYPRPLHEIGEYSLSMLGIPTRLDALGQPVKRVFSDAETAALPWAEEIRSSCLGSPG